MDAQDLIDKMNKRERDMESSSKIACKLLMEKQRLNPDITMWFIGEHCDKCDFPVFTNGKLYWCKEGCIQNWKNQSSLGTDFIREHIR